jgi:hypothetical protein
MIKYDLNLGRTCKNKPGILSLLQSEATKVRELLVGEINQLIDTALESKSYGDEVRNWLKASPRHELTRREVFNFIQYRFADGMDHGADVYNLTFVINIWVNGSELYLVPYTGNFTSDWLDHNVDLELEDFSIPMSDEEYDVNDAAFRSQIWKHLTEIEPLQLHVCSIERFNEFREDCVQ